MPTEAPRRSASALSRRDACKRLGLMGVALLLGGCESFPRPGPQEPRGLTILKQPPLTPEQFEARAGTVEEARAMVARGTGSLNDFVEDFLLLSPRIQAACRPAGLIGSVFYNPRPASIASAVKFQLALERWEPALLHNDLGQMAAAQYTRFGRKNFAAIYPRTISLIGESIHHDRSLLQLVVNGTLPSERIVRTNPDLESLIGRQLTFARQIVRGIRVGNGNSPLRGTDIRDNDRHISKGTVSPALAGALIRLEVAGFEVRMITPADPNEQPVGWQHVSDAYRNFSVGQLIEAEHTVTEFSPHSALEETLQRNAIAEYRPYLSEVLQHLDWGHSRHETYQRQKQEVRADLLAQAVFAHGEEPDPPHVSTGTFPHLKS